MNVIKGTSALTKGAVWIWIDQIVSMNTNQNGGAVIHTADGQTIALNEKPDHVLETIRELKKIERREEIA
jgi:hypothetical protein